MLDDMELLNDRERGCASKLSEMVQEKSLMLVGPNNCRRGVKKTYDYQGGAKATFLCSNFFLSLLPNLYFLCSINF